MKPANRWVVRVIAILLAVIAALLLTRLTRAGWDGRPAYWVTLGKTLVATVVLQVGLFLAPDARGWWRLGAALLMLPAALIFAGLAGETISKVARGYPLHPEGTTLSIAGVAIYLWQYWALARRRP